jgi:hypothetical protein
MSFNEAWHDPGFTHLQHCLLPCNVMIMQRMTSESMELELIGAGLGAYRRSLQRL